jgi:menaquinone-9 beta-reductase
MDACDVLIVGGGPAGSSCAWGLLNAGLDVLIIDKARFPRDKVCGGWITPQVLQALSIDVDDYARSRTLQAITAFRTSRIGDPDVLTDYGRIISYGIRRCEFDEYLLRRCGARLKEGVPLTDMRRDGDNWIVNGALRARLVVGAGGHFCPVARRLGASMSNEEIVAAQEAEFRMDGSQQAACSIRSEVPELYFCPDMRGYGWCFRKGDILNLGFGRLDKHGLAAQARNFLEFLQKAGRIGFQLPMNLLGHAYLVYAKTTRRLVADGVMLIGDSAGLAYSQSGEGIRPAIESGLMASRVIAQADRNYRREKLDAYCDLLTARFGSTHGDWATALGRKLSPRLLSAVARRLLRMEWFAGRVVVHRWFLHADEPALPEQPKVAPAELAVR